MKKLSYNHLVEVLQDVDYTVKVNDDDYADLGIVWRDFWREISQGVLLLKESSGVISCVRQWVQNEELTHYNRKQRKMPFTFCLIATAVFSVANSTFVEFPRNTVVWENEPLNTIDLSCKSDCQCKLIWFMQKNSKSERETLFNGYFLNPHAKSYCTVIADEPGKYSLLLGNSTEAAQTYICMEPGTLDLVSSELIWLSKLVCHDSSTEDLVNLTCKIEFRGNWAPIMEWKEQSSYGEKVLSNGISNDTVPNQFVSSTLIMDVQNGTRNYMCTTKFDISGKPRHTTATNVPDSNLVWMTSVLSKAQDEPLPTWIVITAVTASITISAILILIVVFLIHNKRTRESKQGFKTTYQEKKLQKNQSLNGTHPGLRVTAMISVTDVFFKYPCSNISPNFEDWKTDEDINSD